MPAASHSGRRRHFFAVVATPAEGLPAHFGARWLRIRRPRYSGDVSRGGDAPYCLQRLKSGAGVDPLFSSAPRDGGNGFQGATHGTAGR
jgi:hypothetical protein